MMRITTRLALAVALFSPIGCGGDSSAPTSPTTMTVASVAPSLGAEINTAFIAAMRAGAPVASRIGWSESWLVTMLESLLSQPLSAQAGFVAPCSRGGTVRVQFEGPQSPGPSVTLANTPVSFSGCTHRLEGQDITANGTLVANGFWAASVPTSPVRLSGDLVVNQIGTVAINGSTGASFSGQVGGITVGSPAPASLTGRWTGVAPDGAIWAPGSDLCEAESDMQLDVTHTGTALTGTIYMITRALKSNPPRGCSPSAGSHALTNGTVTGTEVSVVIPEATFRGTVSGNRIAGVVIGLDRGQVGTFAVSR